MKRYSDLPEKQAAEGEYNKAALYTQRTRRGWQADPSERQEGTRNERQEGTRKELAHALKSTFISSTIADRIITCDAVVL